MKHLITFFTLKLCYLYTIYSIYILSKSQNGMVLCNFFLPFSIGHLLSMHLVYLRSLKTSSSIFFSGPTQNSEEIENWQNIQPKHQSYTSWWFSVGICKYKPGYKSHDQLQFECSHWLQLQHSDWRANLVKDFFFQIKFSTNEST